MWWRYDRIGHGRREGGGEIEIEIDLNGIRGVEWGIEHGLIERIGRCCRSSLLSISLSVWMTRRWRVNVCMH